MPQREWTAVHNEDGEERGTEEERGDARDPVHPSWTRHPSAEER